MLKKCLLLAFVQGEYGAVRQSALRQVASVKNWFVDEIDLLELIQRHAETLFQRNNNDEAYEVFSFLLSVSKEGSDLHNEVIRSKLRIHI